MSTVTQEPLVSQPIERAVEPPWRRLAAIGVAIVGAMATIAAVLALGAPEPATTAAWEGRIGPAALAVSATPLEAGPAPQKLTLVFTRPRSGAEYDVLRSVAVRLTPVVTLATPQPAPAPGGPPGPLKAKEVAPGTWEVAVPAAQAVTRSGPWRLRVSASVRPGQAYKQDVPVTYR